MLPSYSDKLKLRKYIMVTQEEVKLLFKYDENTGNLIRKISTAERTKVGEIVGYFSGRYLAVMIKGKQYKIHRLIWLYHYGYLPERNVDHIDRNPINNRIENLREVSQTCNMRNTGNPSDNTSGVKGVCKSFNRYGAHIGLSGKKIHIAQCLDFTEAVAHRLAAEQCVNWEGCDSSSPAYQYMQKYLKGEI